MSSKDASSEWSCQKKICRVDRHDSERLSKIEAQCFITTLGFIFLF